MRRGGRSVERFRRPGAGVGLEIIERAKGIVLSPAVEWRVIEPESGDAGYLFLN